MISCMTSHTHTRTHARTHARTHTHAHTHTGCRNGDVRLVGGENETSGIVEVCENNLWGYIAAPGWNDKDAAVVCKQLGIAAFYPPQSYYRSPSCGNKRSAQFIHKDLPMHPRGYGERETDWQKYFLIHFCFKNLFHLS